MSLSGHFQFGGGVILALVSWCSVMTPWTTLQVPSLRELPAGITRHQLHESVLTTYPAPSRAMGGLKHAAS